MMNTRKPFSNAVISTLIGSALGIMICSVLLTVFSAIFVKIGFVPLDIAPASAMIISGTGAFFAGYLSAKLYKSHGMMIGAISGLLFFASVLIGSLMFGKIDSPTSACIKCLVFVVCASIGGIVRVNKKVKIKKSLR